MNRWRAWWPWMVVWLAAGVGTAALDPRAPDARGWVGYLVISGLGTALLALAWRWVGEGAPRWLALALGLALALRLGTAVGLARALPVHGYEREHQQAGYLFPDAFHRDSDAWELASSGEPLWSAFTERRTSDQYGGLLFLSAAVYRLFSPPEHHPLLLAALAAFVGTLAVPFAWRFAREAFGEGAGALTAWAVALYPEAVVLSASQMREPFVITGLALALLGYLWLRHERRRSGALALASGLILAVLVSPPFGALAGLVVGGAWLWEGDRRLWRGWWLVLAVAALVLLAGTLTLGAWAQVGGWESGGPLDVLGWWLVSGARFEQFKLQQASGWVQFVFERVPVWAQTPLVTLWGLAQPFLPAALADNTAAPLFRGLVIWRALGWFLLLPFLFYAPLAALRREGPRGLATYLALLVWVAAALIAYRTGADQWDNPRYRAFFLVPQAALVGWAWLDARRARSPWLKRAALWLAGACLVFLHWEVGRYYQTPRLSFVKTVAVMLAFSVVYLGGVLLWDWWRARRGGRLTGQWSEV